MSETDREPNRVPSPDRSVSEDERRFAHNMGSSDSRGVRQKSLSRLIILDTVIRYDYQTEGPTYQRWCDRKKDTINDSLMNFVYGLSPDDIDTLRESALEVHHPPIVTFLTDVSERTVWDYLKTITHFY